MTPAGIGNAARPGRLSPVWVGTDSDRCSDAQIQQIAVLCLALLERNGIACNPAYTRSSRDLVEVSILSTRRIHDQMFLGDIHLIYTGLGRHRHLSLYHFGKYVSIITLIGILLAWDKPGRRKMKTQ